MTTGTADGRIFGILNIVNEYTRQCLATLVKRRITSEDVIDQLFNLFIFRAIAEHIRSDNGPEFNTQLIRRRLNRLGVKTLFPEPRGPRENGFIESSDGKLRDGLLNRDTFHALL
jgi:transposase InsO family protein